MKRSGCIIVTVLFLGYIGWFGGMLLVHHDTAFSAVENRYLQTLPTWKWENVATGKWMTQMEHFVTDQFAGRNSWIALKAGIELALGKQENNDVYIGDSYLVKKYLADQTDDESINKVIRFAQDNPELDVTMLLVPSVASLQPDVIDKPLLPDGEYVCLQRYQQMSEGILNWIDVWGALAGKTDLFFKMDHHWNADGAWLAYQAWMKQKGIDKRKEEMQSITLTTSFQGTLYSKAGTFWREGEPLTYLTSKTVQATMMDEEGRVWQGLIDESFLSTKDAYGALLSSNHAHLQIETTADTDRRILIVKDSFANIMIPMMVEEYQTIDVIDLRYYHGSVSAFCKERDITEVAFIYQLETFQSEASLGFLR